MQTSTREAQPSTKKHGQHYTSTHSPNLSETSLPSHSLPISRLNGPAGSITSPFPVFTHVAHVTSHLTQSEAQSFERQATSHLRKDARSPVRVTNAHRKKQVRRLHGV